MGKALNIITSLVAGDFVKIHRDVGKGLLHEHRTTLTSLVDYLSTAFTTLSGLTSVAATTFTGALVGGNRRPVVEGVADTYALAITDSGKVYSATKTSGTQTYTLPAVATAGVYFTFICNHASGEILINPQASEAIVITSFAAVGADADTGIVAPAAGTGIKNTAATNAIGDSITLVSSGTKWFSQGITAGIWASQ